MTQSRGWHREDIKAELRKRGSSLADISTGAGLERKTGAKSLDVPCPTANRAIAAFLRVPLHELWPDWFDQNGNRIPSRSHRTRSASRHKSQKKVSPKIVSTPQTQGEQQ